MKTDFGAVVDSLPGLVWTTDGDLRIDFVNRAWSEYTGLGLDGAIGHNWQTAIHPADLTSFAQSWEVIRLSATTGEIDARLRRFDGEYRWFVLRPSPLPEDHGSDQHWCWLGSDADERVNSDGRFRRLLDVMPVQAGFLNTSMVLEFVNLKSRRDFDMTFDQLKEWTESGIIHADDHETNFRFIEALLAGKTSETDLRFLYPNGSYRWTHAFALPIRDAHGNIVRYLGFQIDVDDLRQAEALLAAEVSLLERVARGEPLAQVLDALGDHVEALCSGCFCGVLAVAPDGKHFGSGGGSSLPATCHDFFNGRIIDGACDPCSLSVITKRPVVAVDLANDPRWQDSPWLPSMTSLGFGSCCATPVVSASGKVCGVVAVYRSQSVPTAFREEGIIDRFTKIAGIAIDRTEADAALNQTRSELAHVARVATLNAMTASIAHEVSQPLSGILTNANTCARMLAADPPNLTVAAETVRRTIRDANRATEVIQRLRAMFSTRPPTVETANLNDVARDVIALSLGELQRAGAIMETDFADDLPQVSIDRVQVQQVILNLLLNAADAMTTVDDRPRTLLVRTWFQEDGNVRLLVRDSGTGIAADKIERLFDAFYTTKAKGMGIGLSISRSIIERHGGRLWAENNEGPGATFRFSIPCA